MEMNQILQPVCVVLKDVLLLVRIAMHLLVLVVIYYHALTKMVSQQTVLPVNADLQNVLLVKFVINLSIYVFQVIAEQM